MSEQNETQSSSELVAPTPSSSEASATTTEIVDGREVTTTRTTYAELELACAPLGGMRGIPQLIGMVSMLMPGGTGLPPAWAAWLEARIAAAQPLELACNTPGATWRLVIDGPAPVHELPTEAPAWRGVACTGCGFELDRAGPLCESCTRAESS